MLTCALNFWFDMTAMGIRYGNFNKNNSVKALVVCLFSKQLFWNYPINFTNVYINSSRIRKFISCGSHTNSCNANNYMSDVCLVRISESVIFFVFIGSSLIYEFLSRVISLALS